MPRFLRQDGYSCLLGPTRTVSLVGLAVSMLVCALAAEPSWGQEQRRVTVMSYNVENLFDNVDNPAREGDNTYLPLSQKGTPAHVALCERNNAPGAFRDECLTLDWSAEVLAKKIANLATVIGRFEGSGPDILVLQEVENQQILDRLRLALPGGSSYVTAVNLDDSPGRGINVAILSKLPQMSGVAPVSTPINFPADVMQDDGQPCGSTRNVTAFTLRLPDGMPLTVFALHMPAGGPAHPCRTFVATVLAGLVRALPVSAMAIAAGDTNLNCGDDDQETIRTVLRPALIVPDEVNKGCRPPGSSFFGPQGWSFLDLIMTSRSLLGSDQAGATWFADLGSFRTVVSAPELQVQRDSKNRISPRRFNPTARTGASDHWPVALDLIRRQ
jgi:endonuclease/exonuclease/phosphatase family metal-dependent hydrolase